MNISHPTNRPNYTEIYSGGHTVAFSYRTPIAVLTSDGERLSRENDWGSTTGKHLNYFGRGKVMSGVEFEAKLKELGL